HCVERRIERQVRILAPAGAEVARRIEGVPLRIEDENPILEHADQVVAELEPRLALAQQRMLEQQSAFPRTLRLQIRVATVDSADRQLGRTHKIEEIELSDRPAQDELRVPAAGALPVEREARL